MKKYDNYKDSGIEWIGEIPEHWKVSKAKFNLNIINGYAFKSEDFQDTGVPVVRIGDLKPPYVDLSNAKGIDISKHKDLQAYAIEKGDLLLAMTGATIGKTASYMEDTISYLNQRVGLIKVYENNSQAYTKYILESNFFKEFIALECSGSAQENIGKSQLGELQYAIPSIAEQTAIANYLDQKTTQIDQLISQKKRFIELLQEERTAVINQAVTKGLDLTVKMKDSGIEWLGEIPEHWEVSRIKYVTNKIGSGVTPRGGAEVYETVGIPLLRSQNVYFDGFRLDNVAYINSDIHDSMNNSKVIKGDVLLNITGGSIGRCYYVSDEFEDANVNQHVCILRPNEYIITEYLYYILSSQGGQLQIDLCQNGGNREALNFEHLKNFTLALPTMNEQNEIIFKIQNINKKIDGAVSKSLQEIELLKEYKTALISEVVTGKIDVRDVVLN
jgi:type I restriction enzyme S subunit